jgi:hypothetical protein
MHTLSLERQSIQVSLLLVLYPVLLGVAFIFGTTRIFDDYSTQFWFLTSLVAGYNIIELIQLYKVDKTLYFIKPVVMGTIILFLSQFGGITNFLLVRRNGDFATLYNNHLEKEPQWLCYSMGIVLGASIFYWFGYKLKIGRMLYNSYMRVYQRFWSFRLAKSRLLLGWLIGAIIKLVINAYGAIGHKYIKLMVEGESLPSFVMRLKVFENLSLLFFIMLLFLSLKEKNNTFLRSFVWVAFVFELVFALTSGARFTIIVLFFSIFLVNYILKKELRVFWIVFLAGILYFSMTVVKGYKDYVFSSKSDIVKEANPLESIQGAIEFNKGIKHNTRLSEDLKEAAKIEVIARFNYVNDLTQMIRYREVEGLKASDPNFVTPFLTFPFFAIFPKFYLFGVEEPKYGYWATHVLTGGRRTSTAISPIGFTYLAGGSILVMVVFFFLGILMKWAGFLMNGINTPVGLILFLAIMSTLIMFDSIVTGSYINLIRYAILLPPLMWLLLRSSK